MKEKRKIKVILSAILAAAMITSILGYTCYAAVTTSNKGVQKLADTDIINVMNNNADILDSHIDKIASNDTLGHIKIGTGLTTSEDGTTNVKIANDLKTDDTTTALSAAMGAQLGTDIDGIRTDLKKFDVLANYTVCSTGTKISLQQSVKNYKYVLCLIGSSNDSKSGLETLLIPTQTIDGNSNEFCGLHNHYGLKDDYSEYQIGFTSDNILEACYVNNVGKYELAISVYGMN